MTRSRRPQLRTRLAWLALAGILPLTVVAGIGLSVMVAHQHDAAQRTTLDLARASGAAVEAELGGAVAVLEAVSTSPLLDAERFDDFQLLMQRVLTTRVHWIALILADPQGLALARATQGSDALPGPAPTPPREPASFAEALRTGQPRIGSMARGASGRWGVPVRVPFRTRTGRALVLTAVLSPEALRRVLEAQRMPQGYVASIFDGRSARVARSVPPPGGPGSPPTPSLAALMSRNTVEGTGTTRSLEGVEVYTAFVRLPQSQWTVAVGVPFSAVASGATQAFAWYGAAILASLLLSLAVARQVSRSIHRPMRRLSAAAQAVERGEVPEVGPAEGWDLAEVHDVALSLRSAAEARQRSEGLLREADQRKDAFIATLSHELRNPLSPIRQAAHVLAAPQATAAQRHASKAIIDRQVHHMALLLEDLLDVARIARGTLSLRKETCRVDAILDEAVELARQAIDSKQHQLEIDRGGTPTCIEADPLRLAQIIANLLTNAAKYTPPGGRIGLHAGRDADALVVEVVDNGQGLAAEHLETAFEMFTQLPAAPGAMVSGLGIGLSLSRALAALHGGTLVAASDGPGQGSRFTLRVPIGAVAEGDAEAGPSRAAETGPGTWPRPRRVLVADDNRDAADSIAALLQLEGYEVEVAYDGEAALDAAHRFHPDVAVLDIGMPRMDGHAVARALRADTATPRPLLVAATGWGQDQDVRRSQEAGFDHHLTKPVAIDTLPRVAGADGAQSLKHDEGVEIGPQALGAACIGPEICCSRTPKLCNGPLLGVASSIRDAGPRKKPGSRPGFHIGGGVVPR